MARHQRLSQKDLPEVKRLLESRLGVELISKMYDYNKSAFYHALKNLNVQVAQTLLPIDDYA